MVLVFIVIVYLTATVPKLIRLFSSAPRGTFQTRDIYYLTWLENRTSATRKTRKITVKVIVYCNNILIF